MHLLISTHPTWDSHFEVSTPRMFIRTLKGYILEAISDYLIIIRIFIFILFQEFLTRIEVTD